MINYSHLFPRPFEMPTRARNERTRAGCWTCRARRKKCDERRPYCTVCVALGLACEGYAVRLRWLPNATRGSESSCSRIMQKETTAILPEKDYGSLASNDECETLLFGQAPYNALSGLERQILGDFLDWGISSLIKTIALKRSKYFPGSSGSKALLASCLAYQVKLDPKYAHLVESYYARSLEQLRMELSDPIRVDKDGAVYAGLLLCFVSMEMRLPWTIHLNGMASIAKERNAFYYLDGSLRPHVFCLGIVDLPTHILGRKTDNLNIWYNYCRFQNGLEDCLGLPCSLVDLLSAITEPDIARHLLSWTNNEGTAEERVIWDLTRHAGVIMAGIYHSDNTKSRQTSYVQVDPISTKSVRHIIDMVRTLRASDVDFTSSTWSTLFFPLIAAASQPRELERTDRDLILGCISDLSNQSMNSDVTRQTTVPVLKELWDNARGRSIQQVARDLSFEIGLF